MFKAIFCLALVANAVVAVPSHVRRHHDLAARMASPNINIEPVAVMPKRRSTGRCKPRPTSSTTTSSVATVSAGVVGNIGSAPASQTTEHSSSSEPSSSKEPPEPSSSQEPPKPSSSKVSSTQASSTQQPQPTQSSSGESGDDSGIHTGDGTYYDTGLTACGDNNTNDELIVAVSEDLFDNYPGYNRVNPNTNPICGKQITANYQGRSVTVRVTDRCTGCAKYDLDFTPTGLGTLDPNYLIDGRIHGVTWQFDD